jgi:hypothetical protein
MIPASSIFQRSSGLIALIARTSSFWNYALSISDVVLLTRTESIRNCFLVLRIGFRLIKLAIHRFVRGATFFLVAKMRPTKALICVCVGLWPKVS